MACDSAQFAPLPLALQQAIAQFPERVEGAIAYLAHCQQQQTIHNPGGYLYRAIVSGWRGTVEKHSILPDGFNEWFERMKQQGLVLAAMAIEGIHHTWDVQLGWVPTTELMQKHL